MLMRLICALLTVLTVVSVVPMLTLSAAAAELVDELPKNEDGSYERYDDFEREYCFSQACVKNLLEKNGFEIISVESDVSGAPVTEKSERLYYTVRKK